MTDAGTIVNKVAKSGLVTIDLEKLFKPTESIVDFDIKPFLFMELLLKEKDFRESIASFDFSAHAGKILAVHCSTDAIIPEWAWMLVAAHANMHVSDIFFGNPMQVRDRLIMSRAMAHDWSQYQGRKVLVKGCGDEPIPSSLYLYATQKLMDYADRLMYGEACSFVPVWRRP